MTLYLPPTQLDRKTYEATNEVLTRIGGKWNRKAKGHIFEIDPTALLDLIFSTGEMPPKNPTAFFATPDALAQALVDIPMDAKRVLEPSAGKGAIARAIRAYLQYYDIEATLDCCEILPRFADLLTGEGFTVVASDFLTYHPAYRYDSICMNPPFALEGDASAYVAHVEHAWSLLAPHGILKAIVPGGFAFREEKRIKTLRSLVEQYGRFQQCERGAFKESGTGVGTVIISLMKPEERKRREGMPVVSPLEKNLAPLSLWPDIA